MAETKIETQAPKRRRWLRLAGWIVGGFVGLLIALYFVATSSGFVKGVIVPRVGNAMNADISVGDAQVSPFKSVVLHDVKLTPKGAEPLFTATEVRLRYSLFSILGGNIAVEEMTVIAPMVTLVEKADGTSNLDPLLKKQTPEKKSPPAKPGSPPSVDVKSVALNHATIRRVKQLTGGGRDVLELANVNITASNIKNGQAGKLDVAASLSMENAARAENAGGSLHATLKGGFSFDLAKNLLPSALKGDTTFAIEKATGDFAELSTLTAKLDCDTTATEIKQLALRFTKANVALGEVRVSGPFDPAKVEGKFKVEILPLDRQVLNLAGAVSGLDFGTTTVKATSEVELTKGGHVISLAGNVDVARCQIILIRQKQTSPTLDLRCDYNVTMNRDEQTITLKTVNLAGTQNQRPFLKAELTSPMTIALGKADVAVGDAALNLAVTDLQLTDWKTYAPEAAPEGKVNVKLKLLSQKGGSHLTFEIDSQLENLSARFGSNQISHTEVRLLAHGQAADLKQFKLDDYRLEVAQQGQAAVTVSGSGTFDKATQDADLQVVVQATLARLLALFPQPDAKFTGGTFDFKGHVTSKKQDKTATGEMVLADLTGSYGNYRFAKFGTWMNLDVAMKGNATEIRKASGHVREGQNRGGEFEVSGDFNSDRKAGQFKLKLADFNQNGLRPFLESALGDKKLVSVMVNSTASASFKSDGDAAVKADFQLANLVVSDPKGGLPTTPLEARVQVDAAVSKKVAQVRQCQLTLTGTNGAKNQLDLTGVVDFSKTNTAGNLKLAAESLDLTRYYDLFAGKPAATATAAKPGASAPNPPLTPSGRGTDSDKEPDPIKLPFQNFTCDVNIGRLRLREVDITKLQTTALINGSHVLLKPCQLTINGAPVNATADLDLSVPGYRYDVTFNAQAVPLTPLVNSFQPDRKGQIGGQFTASAQIKGEGTTGANLQKNLSGQFNVLATNLNLSIENVRSPVLKSVINFVITIPELLKNPGGTVVNWLGKLTGTGAASKSGWLDEFTAAPINVLLVQGDAGKGHIRLQEAQVRSAAFQAQANGDIAIAPILTNSTIDLPVNLALGRSLGERIGLSSSDTNAVYVAMPQLLTVKGTVGKPKEEINKLALVTLAAKAGGGVAKQLGGTTGTQVGGLIDALLGGGKPAPSTPTITNAPAATNVPPTNRVTDLLDLFKKPKK